MEYVNSETGFKINLDMLTEEEKRFYRSACEKFRRRIPWLDFDEFILGMQSPLYKGKRSHLQVLTHPLFLALKDMSLRLGIEQGKIAPRDQPKKGEVLA